MLKAEVIEYLICGIVFTRGANGATISEIRSDFYEVALQNCYRLHRDTDEIVNFLNSLPGLAMDVLPSGAYVWFAETFFPCKKDATANVDVPKSDRKSSGDDGIGTGSSDPEVQTCGQQRIDVANTAFSGYVSQGEPLHVEPLPEMNRRCRDESIPLIEITDDCPSGSTLKAVPIPIQGLSIHCDDYSNADRRKAYPEVLSPPEQDGISYIGDDFMLSFITQEYNYESALDAYPARCGHCISGQTIRMALDELQNHPDDFMASTYLLNLGAMDILIGRDIYEIKADYKELLEKLLELKKLPICTTLPPIFITAEEYSIWPQVYQKLLLFNRFVEDLIAGTPFPFINLWNFLTGESGKPVKPYYQRHMTMVTSGTHVVKFALWNKLGRETLKKNLRAYLEA